jgi:glycolate oxidase iron-sulfur subunit
VQPDVVATGNPGCTLQIAASAAQSGGTMSVLHPIELVDASIRGTGVDEIVAAGIYYRGT